MKAALILALVLHTAVAMKPYNFCKKTNLKCVGSYDHRNVYMEKCELEKCPEQFKYDCGLNVCAKKKLSCKQLNDTKLFIRKMSIPYTKSLETNKLRKYMANFEACPEAKTYLRPTDVCVSGNNCFYIEKSGNKNVSKIIIKKTFK